MVKSPYQITISTAMNDAYIVQIGCWTLAFTDEKTLGLELARFLADPVSVETEYRNKYGAKPLLGEAVQAMPERGHNRNLDVANCARGN